MQLVAGIQGTACYTAQLVQDGVNGSKVPGSKKLRLGTVPLETHENGTHPAPKKKGFRGTPKW